MSSADRPLAADPELSRAAEVLRRLAELWSSAPATLRHDVPAPDAARERLRNGIPALVEEPLLDGRALREAIALLGERLAGVEGYEAVGPLADGLRRAALDWEGLARIAMDGAWDALEPVARRLDVDAEALAALLDYAVRPALRAGSQRVRPLLAEISWARACCPACGAPPLLSVTTGKESARHLLCGRCGAAWGWPRTRCAVCGERDHHRLGYLHAPGEGDYRRVEVCDACRGYMKTVSVLDLPDADRLLRLDLETSALDFIALDAGYSRAGGGQIQPSGGQVA
ncbi:MAG TPA: formate dehydrogenase accessory protein FdhE [Gemmatimonadales bacterium]|nr:formate dehydrogenase accessory protein FdhE [Gemmatimonadales bacterium]